MQVVSYFTCLSLGVTQEFVKIIYFALFWGVQCFPNIYCLAQLITVRGFAGSSAGEESTCNAEDPAWIPGLGSSLGDEIGYPLQYSWASHIPGGSDSKESSCSVGDLDWTSLVWEDALEESMATHSSILAWRMPMDKGAWWATIHAVAELDTTEWVSTTNGESNSCCQTGFFPWDLLNGGAAWI